MERYCVAVIAFGLGSSSSDQSTFGFPPVQAAQLSDETLAIPPNLGVAGLNELDVVALPADPLAPDAELDVAALVVAPAPDAVLCEDAPAEPAPP